MTWLDDILGCNIYEGGSFIKLRRNLNFVGVDCTDNTTTEAVDIYVAGARDWKESVRLATAAALPAYVFDGATNTITAAGVGAMPNIDGVAPAVDDRILLIPVGTTSDVHNGIWVVTSLGGVAANWSLERAMLSDESSEVTPGLHVYVEEGTAYGTHRFVCTNTGAIVLNTTPITLVKMGSTMALVTATTSGAVSAFTATPFMTLQGDGATAGGTWTASPGFGATPGATFRLNLTQTEWIGWNGVHGMMIDAGADLYIGDNSTTDDIILDATTTIVNEIGGTPVTTTRTGEFETAQPVWVNAAAGYLRMGLVAGSGAGSAASVGTFRLQDDGSLVFRNAADGGDVAGVSCDGANNVAVGGTNPTRPSAIVIDSEGSTVIRDSGVNVAYFHSNVIEFSVDDVRFDKDEIAPKFSQEVDSTAAVTGDDLTAAAQDVSDAAGNATSGDFLTRGGQGLVHAGNTDGNVALHAVPANWQALEKGQFTGDAVTEPTGNPAAGVFDWSFGGDKKVQSTGGCRFWLAESGTCAASDEVYVAEATTGAGGGPTAVTMTTLDANDQVAHVELRCIARGQTSGDSATYQVAASFERTGGATTLFGGGGTTVLHVAEEDATWDCTLVAAGVAINAQLTHDAAEAVDWKLIAKVWVNR